MSDFHRNINLMAMLFFYTETAVYEMKDNADGTVLVEAKSRLGAVHYFYFVKKCLQGQVYRKDFNDCRGGGSADNFWLAARIAFCDKNDTSCDALEKNPVYQNCAGDATSGKKWAPLTSLYQIREIPNFEGYFPDIPFRNPVGIWSNASTYSENNSTPVGARESYANYYTLESSSKDLKTSRKFVLCRSGIEKPAT